jgi:hypothetical protein
MRRSGSDGGRNLDIWVVWTAETVASLPVMDEQVRMVPVEQADLVYMRRYSPPALEGAVRTVGRYRVSGLASRMILHCQRPGVLPPRAGGGRRGAPRPGVYRLPADATAQPGVPPRTAVAVVTMIVVMALVALIFGRG